MLIKNGSNVNAKTVHNITPLLFAVSKQKEEIIEILLEAGANIYDSDLRGWTSMILSCNQNIQITNIYLLIKYGGNVNDITIENVTTLMVATKNNNIELVKFLINQKVDPNIVTNNGITALLLAIKNSNIDIVKYLLDYGANINFINKNGETPLHFACRENNLDIVSLLIKYGANINFKSNNNTTPLLLAVHNKKNEIIKFLLEVGANIHDADKKGWTSILVACCITKDFSTISLLLNNSANINDVTIENATILMIAVKNNDLEMVKYAISKEVDINAISNNGLTALFVSIQKSNIDIFKYLLEHGANINHKINPLNLNAVDIAIMYNSLDIAIHLIKNLGMCPNHLLQKDIFLNPSTYGLVDKNDALSNSLTNNEKILRVEILKNARKSYLNWQRRWPYVKFFVGHKFILMKSVRKDLKATALPTNVKIPNLQSRTRLQKYSNLLKKVFCNEILEHIFGFI